MVKSGLLDDIIDLLRAMKTAEEDYKPPTKGKMPPIHDKILRTIKEKLEARFRRTLAEYGIDYVKREDRDPEHGRIELAVEVDRWRGSFTSWKKLLDVRADNRLWVFIPDEDKLEDFEWALSKLRELIMSRGDDGTITRRFAAVLKRPAQFKVEELIKSRSVKEKPLIKQGKRGPLEE